MKQVIKHFTYKFKTTLFQRGRGRQFCRYILHPVAAKLASSCCCFLATTKLKAVVAKCMSAAVRLVMYSQLQTSTLQRQHSGNRSSGTVWQPDRPAIVAKWHGTLPWTRERLQRSERLTLQVSLSGETEGGSEFGGGPWLPFFRKRDVAQRRLVGRCKDGGESVWR